MIVLITKKYGYVYFDPKTKKLAFDSEGRLVKPSGKEVKAFEDETARRISSIDKAQS